VAREEGQPAAGEPLRRPVNRSRGNMDSLEVKVERREPVSADDGTLAGGRLADRVKHLIGIRVGVEVSGPYTVERSAGKMRRIVDHREGL
jgi:phenylacetate-CoA ligase